MSAVFNVDNVAVVHRRLNIAVRLSNKRERRQNVYHRDKLCLKKNSVHISANRVAHRAEIVIFNRSDALVCAENGVFHIFKLLGDISFTVCKRLLPYISVGRFVDVRFCDFNIISENSVV